MRNEASWRPTKVCFDPRTRRFLASREHVRTGSLFFASLSVEPVVSLLQRYARGRLLDAGCGSAPYYIAYRERVSSVTCVDWQGGAHGTTYLDHEVDLNQPLPLASSSFDTVLLSDVLEHIAEPQALLNELARVLAPGGHLLVSVPFFYWLHERPADYYRFSEHALRHMSGRAGLSVLELSSYGGYPDVALDLVNKVTAKLPGLGRWVAEASVRMARASAYGAVRKKLHAERFPAGYVMCAMKPADG